MFSHFRNAVEQLAQQPIRAVTEATSSDHSSERARTGSLDMNAARSSSPPTSTELAESALSTLRKSLGAQRTTTTPPLPAKTPSPSSSENTRPRKSNLEERLRRATYAHIQGDASSSTTSKSARTSSPSPMSANRKPMPKPQEKSPYTTPLPASPQVLAAAGEDDVPRLSVDGKPPVQESKLKNELNSEQLVEPTPTQQFVKPGSKGEEFDDPLRSSSSVPPKSTSLSSEKPPKVEPTPKEDTAETAASSDSLAPHIAPSSSTSSGATSNDPEGAPAETTSSSGEDVQTSSPTDESPLINEEKKEDGDAAAQREPKSEDSTDTVVHDSSDDANHVSENDQSVKADSKASVEPNDDNKLAAHDEVNQESVASEDDELAAVEEQLMNASVTQESVVKDSHAAGEGDAPTESEVPLKVGSSPAEGNDGEEDLSMGVDNGKEELPMQDALVGLTEEVKTKEDPITSPLSVSDNSAEVESLQARLKEVELRFADVSTSFKRLQAEKLAADAVLRDVSPLDGINDADALRNFFQEIQQKDKVFQDEIKRLNQKLELQEDRLEEMRDTHRLESHSRSDEVKKIRTQLEETEKLFQAAQRATSNAEEVTDKRQQQINELHKELEKSKTTAKEEEEKRVKAISLLKSVRQKLVKAEKDKEEATRELATVKERERGDKDKENAEKRNHQQEVDGLNSAHERTVANLKVQFNKDFTNMRERYEQEINALRGQSSLDLASAKSMHAKELDAKMSQIKSLENSLNNVSRDKNAFFDQLQLRQAELESAQAHLESLQHQNTELQFQLREASDRIALLKEEASELMREQQTRAARDPGASAEEIGRQVAATEAKYEARLAEVRRNLALLEKERYESEADWSRKLKEKVKELEEIKRVLGSATRSREADESVVAKLRADLQQSVDKARVLERQVSELPHLREQISELEKNAKEQEQESSVKIHVIEKQIEELRAREVQMKQSNKTLRDELRKVQSSAALLERQRNPGVGYWTTRASHDGGSNGLASPVPRSPVPPSPVVADTRVSSPAPSSPAPSQKNDEEVNLEYLRNVILQFLEHKEMRPNLVKVLSIILHFTPQETRRLIARV